MAIYLRACIVHLILFWIRFCITIFLHDFILFSFLSNYFSYYSYSCQWIFSRDRKIPETSGKEGVSDLLRSLWLLHIRFPYISCLPCRHHLCLHIRNMLKWLCREGSEYSIFLTLLFTEIVEFISKSMDFILESLHIYFESLDVSFEGIERIDHEYLEVLVSHSMRKIMWYFSGSIYVFLWKSTIVIVRVLEEDLTVSEDHTRWWVRCQQISVPWEPFRYVQSY